jgi:hypothetical protein
MRMQNEYAADVKHGRGYREWICSIDIWLATTLGQVAWASSMGKQHGQAAWTSSTETWTWSMDTDMQQ